MSVTQDGAAYAPSVPPRGISRRPLALIAAALVLLALVAATVGYLWLRSYMPIRLAGTGGPGPSSLEMRVVRDVDRFGERTAYVVSGERPGRFGVYFDVTNAGRLPITIEGLAGEDGGSLLPPLKLHGGVTRDGSRFLDFSPFTLDGGETAFLGLEVVAGRPCEGFVRGGSITWESVSLRYSYARFFERVATIQMPVVMSLAC